VAVLIRIAAAALVALALTLSPALAIFGGKLVPSGDPVGKMVAAVLYHDSTGAHLCSAVALRPRLLLTAAHCTSANHGGMSVIFSTVLRDVQSDRIRSVAKIARAASTATGKGTPAFRNPDDVALLLLSADAPAGTSFAHLLAASPKSIRIAGYGASSDDRALGSAGFDAALRFATVPVSASSDALLTADQGHGAGACTGDSGGPALSGSNVVGVLVGVANSRRSADYCRGKAYFAAIGRWMSWIETTAASLGQPLQ